MNLLLLKEEELDSKDRAVLKEARARGAIDTHSLKEGVTLTVGVVGGLIGKGKVISASHSAVEIEVLLQQPPPARVPAVAIVAVCRPQSIKKIIQVATTVGIEELHFVRSENSEKSYLDSHTLLAENLAVEVWKGLEQAQDTVAPVIEVHERFKPFLGDALPKIKLLQSSDKVALIGDTRSKEPVSTHLNSLAPPKAAAIAIGSENGWSEYELTRFQEVGFHPISLGPRMLRVDAALALILGQFDLIRAK